MNYYDLLNVPNFSSFNEIKAKYKELMKIHHPDKGGDSIIFNKYKEAYEFLKNNKDEHDRKLKCNNY